MYSTIIITHHKDIKRMKKFGILTLICFFTTLTVWGQDEVWEAKKQITGYIATEFNYLNNV